MQIMATPTKTMEISEQVVADSMSYPKYRELIDGLMAQQKTTGDNHSADMLNYTKLNQQRMKRLDKTTKLTEASINLLENYTEPITWLVLTEAWCGDAAQIVPVLQHLADANEHITLKVILRDENLEVMDQFLTNGGRSIPKIISLHPDTLQVKGSWGPRPEEVQQIVMDAKHNPNADMVAVKTDIQKWYAKDKTVSIQKEALAALLV